MSSREEWRFRDALPIGRSLLEGLFEEDRVRRAAFAAKTVLAAVVCALAFEEEARRLQLLAALSGAFATQFIAGTTRRVQRRVFAGAGCVLALLSASAAATFQSPLAREALIAGVAFAVAPVRALLPGRPMSRCSA